MFKSSQNAILVPHKPSSMDLIASKCLCVYLSIRLSKLYLLGVRASQECHWWSFMFDLFVQGSHWSLNHLMIVHQPYQIQSYISGKWFSSFPLLWSVLLTTAMLDSIQAIFWFSFTVNFRTESRTIFISLQVHEYIFDPSLSSSFHLSCMDASIAIKPVFDRFQSVVQDCQYRNLKP